jgi:type I restriction enzyme S subunit
LPLIEKQNEIAEHIQSIRTQAKALQQEAVRVMEEVKREVERMIIGE